VGGTDAGSARCCGRSWRRHAGQNHRVAVADRGITRLKTLIDEILAPVRAATDDLSQLIALIDLQPVIDGVEAVFQEVRGQLLAYSPSVLLHDQLTAFAALKQTLLDFDPLAAILTLLDGLRDTAARIVLAVGAGAPVAARHATPSSMRSGS
jgi:hypothetical protein